MLLFISRKDSAMLSDLIITLFPFNFPIIYNDCRVFSLPAVAFYFKSPYAYKNSISSVFKRLVLIAGLQTGICLPSFTKSGTSLSATGT